MRRAAASTAAASTATRWSPTILLRSICAKPFAQQIAAALEEGRQAGHYTQLIIVAAPAMLGELRRQLSDPTGKLVVAEYSKDLPAMMRRRLLR